MLEDHITIPIIASNIDCPVNRQLYPMSIHRAEIIEDLLDRGLILYVVTRRSKELQGCGFIPIDVELTDHIHHVPGLLPGSFDSLYLIDAATAAPVIPY